MLGRHISAVQEAEQIVSEHQSVSLSNGVTVPTWLFAGGIGLILGVVIGPSIMASTEAGSRRLAEMSKQYIERR